MSKTLSDLAGQVSRYVRGTLREMFSKTGLDVNEIAMVMGSARIQRVPAIGPLERVRHGRSGDQRPACGVLNNDVPGELGIKIAHELI